MGYNLLSLIKRKLQFLKPSNILKKCMDVWGEAGSLIEKRPLTI